MKSQSQLQQQAAAAALVKKSGAHGAAGNGRRLRRNVDVVVNALAMKNRSHSSNLSQQVLNVGAGTYSNPLAGGQGNATGHGLKNSGALSTQQQYPFLNPQLFHKKQMQLNAGGASGPHHSHSQQVLDNSQAIQQKINMYSNMVNIKKQGVNAQASPIIVKAKTNSSGSQKIVPAHLSRAFLQQRQHQTPNPAGSQPQQQPSHYSTGNIVQQFPSQVAGNKPRTNLASERSSTQAHQNSNNNISSYYDIGMAIPSSSGKIAHHHSAQQLEQIPRSVSQQPSKKEIGHPRVQIKAVAKANRNHAYGGTLTNRQISTNQLMNQGNTLYSQISLKEIQTPIKQYKVAQKNIQKITGTNFYGQPRAASQTAHAQEFSAAKLRHDSNYGQQVTQQIVASNSAQAFVPVQYATAQQQMQGDGQFADLKNMQHLMIDNISVDQQEQNSSQQPRSRNMAANVVSTNGATTNHGSHPSQGAILNINTASDINIYNNSFIVRTSPGQAGGKNPTKQSATATNSTRQGASSLQKRKGGNSTGPGNGGVGNQILNRTASGKRTQPGARLAGTGVQTTNIQHIVAAQPGGTTPTLPSQAGRSVSTGRQLKGPRSQGKNQHNSGANNQSKTTRVHEITDAYNAANRNYVIKNQFTGGQQPHIPGTNLNQVPAQQAQSWREQHQQPNNVYQPTGRPTKKNGGKGYNSTENIVKRSDDAQLGAGMMTGEVQHRNSSLNRPQYNNLVQDSQKRLVFAQESGITMTTKRNFKNVRKNREAFSTQPVGDGSGAAGAQKQLGKQNVFQKQKQTVMGRCDELISQGRQKIKSKEFNEAIKIFTEVLDSVDPNNIDAIFYRAISYLDQGNLQQAISELWRVVKAKDSTDPHEIELCQQAFVLLSIAHKRLGETQNAMQDLQQCIEVFPQYPDAYLARGQNLLLQEEFSQAQAVFENFIRLNKNSFSGYLGVGDCQKAKRKFAEASAAYTQAIKLLQLQRTKANYEQLYQQCYMKRGLSGYHEGKYQQALTDLQLVIEKDTSNVKAHFHIGKMLAKGIENEQSKQTDAILHFEQVAKYPDQEFYFGNALFQIAKLRLRQKDYYEAYHCLKRATDNNFTSKRLAMYKDFTEGVLYLIKRKIKKGVQILSDLLEILVNKDKDSNEEESKQTIDQKKRKTNKAHQHYLIHQILLYRAYGYVAIEKYEVAQEDIRRIGKYGNADAASIYNKWLGKGILRMDHEDYLMASKFFAKAWKKYPANKDPYCLQVISIVRSYSYSLGGYFIDQQIKFEKVLETKRFMDKAITNCCAQNKESSLYFFRGLLNFQMYNFYDALGDFNQAIDCEEESSAHYFLARGRTYACLSILSEAMKDLSVALNLDETLQQAYIYRGKCAYLIGDNNLAFLDFQRLILTDPKNPMVHVYAGNLLMTTGAYQDAVKAYENADTVEPTTISAFQRVRCFCALSELENAKVLLEETEKLQPDEVILKFDGACLDELIKVADASERLKAPGMTPAAVKATDKVLTGAISTLDELLSTYESDRLHQLKRRDSILNVQIIPNVEKIKIEKAMVAQDIHAQKQQLPEESRADLPSLSVDLDEPINPQNLRKAEPYSYYYENIFNVEDFYLYRGVFKFYQQRYVEAFEDFERACKAYKECLRDINGALHQPHQSGFNSRNPTLQHYTMTKDPQGRTSNENTLQSNNTDLSDIGLSSFNELEISYNILLCHLFMNDRTSTFNKLNELQRKLPKKYTKQIPLLRIVVLELFKESEKAKNEITRLSKADPELFNVAFEAGAQPAPFIIEIFPSEGRLCSQFAAVKLRFAKGSLLAGKNFQVRLSFSMPFIKPPNMIPNVDEESIQSEFNLKQIDAPMPEAPWIKRSAHGITFTNTITKDGKDRDKYIKFFEEKKRNSKNKGSVAQNDDSALVSARTRLIDNMVAETVSDLHQISLMDDASPRIDQEDDDCPPNQSNIEMNQDTQSDADDSRSSNQLNDQDSNESYDSEDMLEKGAVDAMAIRASGNLIAPVSESLVNMGENLTKNNIRELKKMKKEIVGLETNDGIQIGSRQLLPKYVEEEEIKMPPMINSGENRQDYHQKRTAKNRYIADLDESEDCSVGSGILPDSQKISTGGQPANASSKLVKAVTEAEPHGLNDKMLIGASQRRKNKERRVSNLSIGELPVEVNNPKAAGGQKKQIIDTEEVKQQHSRQQSKPKEVPSEQRRSLFRTSIVNDEDDEEE